MAGDFLWIALITIVVISLDYRSQTHLRFDPGFFKNHFLPRNAEVFFTRYGKVLRFSGLLIAWLGLMGVHFTANRESFDHLYASLTLVIVGVILHQGEQGWMFLMKKKKK